MIPAGLQVGRAVLRVGLVVRRKGRARQLGSPAHHPGEVLVNRPGVKSGITVFRARRSLNRSQGELRWLQPARP